MAVQQELQWQTKDGLTIHGKRWMAIQPRATLLIVHGIGEHLQRYDELANFFCSAGFVVFGNDRRGHGLSDGQRGHAPSLKVLLDEIERLIDESRRQFSSLPIILLGQSMGGNLVLNYCLRRQPQLCGVIALSPWIELAFQPSPIKRKLGEIVEKFFPRLAFSNGLNPADLSTDPEAVRRFRDDPLVHGNITAGLAAAMFDAAETLQRYQGPFPLSLLMMQGTHDRIVSFPATQAFAQRLDGPTSFVPWEGLFHELHHEIRRQEVFDTMLRWINQQLDQVAESESR